MGYRYFAIRAARRLGITGTVRNLADGTVEAIAEGKPHAMQDFRAELERGPAYGRVTAVDEVELQPTGRYTDFEVTF